MSLREFFFGKPCPDCLSGHHAVYWSRYDGTGTWRMHRFYDRDEEMMDFSYCQRNGWFVRHWIMTGLLIAGPSVIAILTFLGWMWPGKG